MKKQVFILNSDSGNVGVAKIVPKGNKFTLMLQLDQSVFKKNKCFAIINNEIVELGTINKKNEVFNFDYQMKPESIFIAPDKTSVPYAWSGIKPELSKTVAKSSEVTESVPEYFTFENYFGGGFEWRRIRGNFIIFDYSIIHYILSIKNVYPAINRAGYYWAGIREDEDVTLIAIAIPKIKGTDNPFSSLSADIYMIKSDKMDFWSVCTGIDKTGEFFLSI